MNIVCRSFVTVQWKYVNNWRYNCGNIALE